MDKMTDLNKTMPYMSEVAKALAYLCYVNRDVWGHYDLYELLEHSASHVKAVGGDLSAVWDCLIWYKWSKSWDQLHPSQKHQTFARFT